MHQNQYAKTTKGDYGSTMVHLKGIKEKNYQVPIVQPENKSSHFWLT